ncbi:hypothetical protein AK812_SmicGene4253 [Symbiodinium microadriaticum]|uniref:Uncharacterized protein n=1 Tax=Symbiodinium microadriaticum TaxID=2951 RepID=A0A1Q9EWK8_SYMMI|nr:hypothetical protein AK812_SmicGene4253 [Symbiodinium microadriaticum]
MCIALLSESPLESVNVAEDDKSVLAAERKTTVMRVQNRLQQSFAKRLKPGQGVWEWSFESDTAESAWPPMQRATVTIAVVQRSFTGPWVRGQRESQLEDRILQFKKGKEPKEVDVKTLRSAPAQALYIMDADIDVEHGVDCQSLWITSARRHTEHFKKAERFSGQFFMPPWVLEEMLNAEVKALHELNDEVVKERFGIFGGTARLVLERDETRAVNDKERLVEGVQSADALQCLKVSSDMKALSKTTHLLVKMHPKRKFSAFDVQLSSPYVRQELVKQNRAKRSQALWDRIDDGMITGIGFALFEEEFHQFMQDKSIGKFKLRARCLTADGMGSETTQELQGGLEGVLISGNPAPDINDSNYYQPQSKNFPLLTHGPQRAKDVTKTQPSKIVHALNEKHDSKAKFFFVVPQFQFDKWKIVQKVIQSKMADKIEQWACKMVEEYLDSLAEDLPADA